MGRSGWGKSLICTEIFDSFTFPSPYFDERNPTQSEAGLSNPNMDCYTWTPEFVTYSRLVQLNLVLNGVMSITVLCWCWVFEFTIFPKTTTAVPFHWGFLKDTAIILVFGFATKNYSLSVELKPRIPNSSKSEIPPIRAAVLHIDRYRIVRRVQKYNTDSHERYKAQSSLHRQPLDALRLQMPDCTVDSYQSQLAWSPCVCVGFERYVSVRYSFREWACEFVSE